MSKSKFRSGFKLKDKDKKYILDNRIDKIIEHAYDIINKRLVLLVILNDGKQTPMKGHPVFIAQHAIGNCCRFCLYKLHNVNKNKKLNDNEINCIVSIIISWIIREMNR